MGNGEIIRIFTREEFLALSEEERVKMGLRTLRAAALHPSDAPPLKAGLKLEIRELCCEIKRNRVFDHVSFSAYSGEIVGITGNNGVGKSTLMRCLAGLIKEKSGAVLLNGKALTQKQRNKACFCVMQDVNHQLFSDSVWNECKLSVSGDDRTEIKNVLRAFDLYQCKESHPMALSGGQKQRLAIACGVLSGKKVHIFDEPTSGLDYERMIVVSNMIRRLADDQHIVLIVTHDMEFLNSTCDRTIALTVNGME